MNNYEIVKKIIGQIKPVGNTEIDTERFENLKATTELVDLLVFEIESVSGNSNAHEYSVNKAGNYAKEFLLGLKNRI